jgi:hypothetical protein
LDLVFVISEYIVTRKPDPTNGGKPHHIPKFSYPNSSRTIFSVPKLTIKHRFRTITMSTQHSTVNRQAHQLAPQQPLKGSVESKNNGGSRRPFQPLSSNADRPTADKVSFLVFKHISGFLLSQRAI